MAEIELVEPVIRICAVISRYAEVRQWAIERITDRWGQLVLISHDFPFTAGGFYDAQMGRDLRKVMVACRQPCQPDGLAEWKLETNAWEREFAEQSQHPGAQYPESRPLNLDPGYVTQAKLVLATTKDRDHRLYLHDGIFAEVTLNYTAKQWVSHRWTYPDYRTDEMKAFAQQCRDHLREHIQATGQFRARV
ncbi:DUF4416 family protein [Stieleria varia]|uniref:GTP-binding protein n=1 Tax=Stieleria varia TaxID=2528005 RepID=A0A5C6APB3_9BACT|nr:DUF4416 family protein [Stieleria varia]TWU01119.1 hypothetical protein Pla52n_44910 [Stieleria varia]